MFYASYGSFIHKLIENYYRGIISKDEMPLIFLRDFSKEVRGERPASSTVDKYIRNGCEYLNEFKPFRFRMIDVEKKVNFKIGKYPFVGFIDYLGADGDDLVIVDNKSRDLKPRSGRKNPTQKDIELDTMLRQLYIYSSAVKQEYGKFPSLLCFNCFRSGVFIEEPFRKEEYDKAMEWSEKEIGYIADTDEFYPRIDFFSCRYICGVRDECCYKDLR